MRKLGSVLPLAAMLCVLATAACADTIVQTQQAGLNNVGNFFAAPVFFNQFNPTLGTLSAISLDLQGSFSGTVGIENLSNVPDVASGIIAGTITVATSDSSVVAQVDPFAIGPTHDLSAFDGTLDFGGTSGATDPVSGAPVDTTVMAPGSAFSLFTGNTQIFLTLSASTFPLVQGNEVEAVEDTAHASATVQLSYTYAPVPEPGTAGLLAIGGLMMPVLWRRSRSARPSR